MQQGAFNPNFTCVLCGRLHAIRQCTRFQVMNIEEKLRVVARHSLCTNCLAQSHLTVACRTLDRCKQCLQDHNTWLHPLSSGKLWLKMSAHVRLLVAPGRGPIFTRVLIDPNAARSSITLSEAMRLRCPQSSKNRTSITLLHRSRTGWRLEVQCAIENRESVPVAQVYRAHHTIRVADDQEADLPWCHRRQICITLGADVASRILIGPSIGRPGRLMRQKTAFGEVYFGVADIVH